MKVEKSVRLKKLFIYLLVGIFCIKPFSVVQVKGATSDDYKTFSQGDPRWGDYKVHDANYTIRGAGCFITAIAVVMAYANPDLRDVTKFNPQVLCDAMTISDGNLHGDTCVNADKTFKLVSSDRMAFSAEEATKRVMDSLSKGYYVVVQSKGQPITNISHFSPIVGTDGGKPLIWDVNGGACNDWDTWANSGIYQIDSFESSKTKSTDTLQGGTGKYDNSSSSDSTKKPTDEAVAQANMTIETDLVGMPVVYSISEGQTQIILQDRSALSKSELSVVDELSQSIEMTDKGFFDYVNIVISFLGIAFLVYGVVMFVCMLLDNTNNFIDVSLLSIITMGKWVLVSSFELENDLIKPGYNESKKKTYLTTKMAVLRACILEAIGVLLVSGTLSGLITRVMSGFL